MRTLRRTLAAAALPSALLLGLAGAAGAQAAVNIESPANGAYINDLTPTLEFSGALPDDSVSLSLTVGGPTLETVLADGDGNGSITVDPGLAATPVSRSVSLVVDDSTTPTTTVVNLNTVPSFYSLITADTVSIKVFGIPDGEANFYLDDDLPVLVTTDAEDGSVELAGDIPAGHHTAYATTVDDDGYESTPSETLSFDVLPTSPEFADLDDGSHLNTGEQDIAVSGVDVDASVVTVYDAVYDDVAEDYISSTAGTLNVSDSDGTETVAVDLTDDHHLLYVAQTVNGVESEHSILGSNGVTVKSAAPVLNAIDTPSNDASPQFEVDNVLGNNVGNDNQVKLYIDDELPVTDSIGGGDSTYVTAGHALAEGPHTAYVTTVDDHQHEGVPSNTVSFTVDTIAPAVTFTSPTEGQTLTTATPTYTVHTEPGAQVALWLGDGTDATLTADGDGNASYTATQPLFDGEHTYGATVTDAADNSSDGDVYVTFYTNTAPGDGGGGGGNGGDTPPAPTPPPVPTPTPTPVPPVTTPTNPVDVDGDGIDNNWLVGGKAAPAPATPKAKVSAGKVELKLAAAPKGATKVRVYRADGKGGYKLVQTLTAKSKSFTDKKVKAGHTYKYKTVAVNAKGQQGKASGAVTAKVKKKK